MSGPLSQVARLEPVSARVGMGWELLTGSNSRPDAIQHRVFLLLSAVLLTRFTRIVRLQEEE